MKCKAGQRGRVGVGNTSSSCCELSPADKTEVSCSSPECLSSIPKTEASVEMISLKSLTIVDGVIATGCMGTVYPNLQQEKGISHISLGTGTMYQYNYLGTDDCSFLIQRQAEVLY